MLLLCATSSSREARAQFLLDDIACFGALESWKNSIDLQIGTIITSTFSALVTHPDSKQLACSPVTLQKTRRSFRYGRSLVLTRSPLTFCRGLSTAVSFFKRKKRSTHITHQTLKTHKTHKWKDTRANSAIKMFPNHLAVPPSAIPKHAINVPGVRTSFTVTNIPLNTAKIVRKMQRHRGDEFHMMRVSSS
jgi:hypothetical protein